MSRLAVACVLAPLILVGGCAATDGPASMGGDSSALCVESQVDDEFLVGEVIKVPDGSTITVRDVALAGPHDISVEDAWLSEDLTAVIGTEFYPPTDSATWDARVAAKGAEIDSTANVIVLVKRTGDDARADAIVVTYDAGGGTYKAQGTTRLTMKDACDF